MALFILKSFAKARSLFGNVKSEIRADEIRSNIAYFFNAKALIDGNPPMDRNCFTCNKIGHQTRDCPLARRRQDANANSSSTHAAALTSTSSEPAEASAEAGSSSMSVRVICYKCQTYGHMAKDCPRSSSSSTSSNKNQQQQQQQKTPSNSVDLSTAFRCFRCNQAGHFARDCRAQIQQSQSIDSHTKSAPIGTTRQLYVPQSPKQQQQQQQQQLQQASMQSKKMQPLINQQQHQHPHSITITNSNLKPSTAIMPQSPHNDIAYQTFSSNNNKMPNSKAQPPQAKLNLNQQQQQQQQQQQPQIRPVILQRPQPSSAPYTMNNVVSRLISTTFHYAFFLSVFS